jgi:hypothetical protein
MFFLIFILIFQIIKTDEIKTNKESSENKIRIYDEIDILQKDDYNELKDIIEKNFPLLLIRLLSGEEDIRKKNAYFEALSDMDFDTIYKLNSPNSDERLISVRTEYRFQNF